MTKTKVMKEGTEEWTKTLMEEAQEHILARHDIVSAHVFAQRLVDGWDSLNDVIQSSLFHSIITLYARPFFENKTNQPGRKFRYRISGLKNASGFDCDLHEHICELRRTLIAHWDTSVIKARVGDIAITPQDGSKPPLVLQTFGMTKALHGFATKEVAERYLRHIASCEAYLTQASHDALGRLHMARVHYPEVRITTIQSLPAFQLERLPDGTFQLPNIEALANMNQIAEPNSFISAESYLGYPVLMYLRQSTSPIQRRGSLLLKFSTGKRDVDP